MLGKIFNKSNKKEFYLAIDEAKETASAVIDEAKETASAVIDEAKENVSSVTDVVTDTVAETKTKVTEVIESAPSPQAIVETVTKSESEPTKATASKKAKKGQSKTVSKQESAAPVYSGASSWEQPFWVKAMYKDAASNSSASGTKTEPTFATDYLLVKSTSRRRPGPSLNKFKKMVSQKKF